MRLTDVTVRHNLSMIVSSNDQDKGMELSQFVEDRTWSPNAFILLLVCTLTSQALTVKLKSVRRPDENEI